MRWQVRGAAPSAGSSIWRAIPLLLVGLLGLRLFTGKRALVEVNVGQPAEAAQDDEREVDGDGREEREPEQGRTAAEWTGLALSATVVLALVGLVSYQHLAGGSDPPTIEVSPRLDEIRRTGSGYYLPVEVSNAGNQTAEDVFVRLSLASGSGQPESADFQIRFLPGGGRERMVVLFHGDPAAGQVKVDGVTFSEP